VLGHFHLPFIDSDESFTLLSLGDWIGHFSYGQLDDGQFSLCSFS
jgi:UDP-2,3-diacylglucosamine hydrolase